MVKSGWGKVPMPAAVELFTMRGGMPLDSMSDICYRKSPHARNNAVEGGAVPRGEVTVGNRIMALTCG